jgi:hypothetical protein
MMVPGKGRAYVVGVDFATLSGRAVVVAVDNGEMVGSAVREYVHDVLTDSSPKPDPKTDPKTVGCRRTGRCTSRPADLSRTELALIDADPTVRRCAQELRWNQAYHRLANGL